MIKEEPGMKRSAQGLLFGIAAVGAVSGGPAAANNAVNCLDLRVAGLTIGKRTGRVGFVPTADIDGSGVTDLRDISAIARLVPAGTRCN
jgi:hypothetical protein